MEPGTKADLEVAAKAALIFASVLREVAYAADPSLIVRIELLSGTESSLSLNGRIRAIVKDKIAEVTVASVAGAISLWLLGQTAQFVYNQLLGHLISHAESGQITKEQIEDIVHTTVDAYQRQGARRAAELFKQLDTDDAIAGVGASTIPGARPTYIIPKSEFRRRAEQIPDSLFVAIDGTRRIRKAEETLTLVSPVLLEGDRRWRFLGVEGEFGASIKDGNFLDSALRGLTTIPMVAGIKMVVEIETIEDATNGVWEVRERNILRVLRVIEPPVQFSLGVSSSKSRKRPTRHTQSD